MTEGRHRFFSKRSGISFGVRGEYHETATGVERRDGKRAPPLARGLIRPQRRREHFSLPGKLLVIIGPR